MVTLDLQTTDFFARGSAQGGALFAEQNTTAAARPTDPRPLCGGDGHGAVTK